ncbi:MAG: radical SAM protein, partial [Nitrospinota bacterium]|nr:radical SAM protein [Nitrospinota bacterium]
ATDLTALLEAILSKTDIARMRLSSINPNNITQRLVDLMVSESRFCPHLHIPLQNGSDRILKLMRRPYTSAMYEDLLSRLAERIEGIGLGADVMTGFPGETEEDFEMTRSLIERLPLMMMHVFSYSSRAGTEAHTLPGAVVRASAKERTAKLKAISDMKRREFISSHEGKEMDVLVESSRTTGGKLKGFTANYIPAVFDGPDEMSNTIVRVIGQRAKGGALECRIPEGA